jgi:hypothetical protein
MDKPLDEQVRDALKARKGRWPAVAVACKVSHSWIWQFVDGRIPNPRYATLKRIADFCAEEEAHVEPKAA